MAKRKRLMAFGGVGDEEETSFPSHLPPVARIAADAATQAALDDLAAELRQARSSGRMVLDLPLDAIEATHLQRDRMHMDPDDMASLKASIRHRNQQIPIDVVSLPNGRYGLISGARRLTALKMLHDETGDARFATIKALLRPFDAAPEAYLAMVEENEIRADLSFYERGRLAFEAARLGVFDSPAVAVRMLFQHAPAPKRSKILSFVALHEALGDALRFPEAIPEKLGLALVKAMQENPEMTFRLRDGLAAAEINKAADERKVLETGLQAVSERKPRDARPDSQENAGAGIRMEARPGKVVLSGGGVTDALIAALGKWLDNRS